MVTKMGTQGFKFELIKVVDNEKFTYEEKEFLKKLRMMSRSTY